MVDKKIVKKLISDLEKNIYCRLKPSKIEGVGIFAIRDIPKGVKLFKTSKKIKFIGINPDLIFDNPKIDDEAKKMVKDFCAIEKGKLYLPDISLNEMDIGFFINYSRKPNVSSRNGEDFFALRDIKKGEELTVDYSSYCDKDKIIVK